MDKPIKLTMSTKATLSLRISEDLVDEQGSISLDSNIFGFGWSFYEINRFSIQCWV